jgi:hypothetical protein
VVVGYVEPSRILLPRSRADATLPEAHVAVHGGDGDPPARHLRFQTLAMPAGVPRAAAPSEGSVRLGVVDGVLHPLLGFPRGDVKRAPPGFGARHALADLPPRGSIAPVAQRGAHGIVTSGSGADELEHLFGLHAYLLLLYRAPSTQVYVAASPLFTGVRGRGILRTSS